MMIKCSRCGNRLSHRFSRSSLTNVSSAVDDDRVPCEVVGAKDVQDGARNVFGTAVALERSRTAKTFRVGLAPAVRQQNRSRSHSPDADLGRENARESA